MKRRYLLLFMALILSTALSTAGVFAGEEAALSVQAANILQAAETLETDTVPLSVVAGSAGVTAVVRNFDELEAALSADNVSGAYLFNDIEMDYALYIDNHFIFENLLGQATIYSAPGQVHFIFQGGGSVIDFGNVILDGRGISGGIEDLSASVTIKNGILQNCNVTNLPITAAITSAYDLNMINFTIKKHSGSRY